MNEPRKDGHTGPAAAHAVRGSTAESAADRVADALRGLRYGSVLVIVQDGVVVQIERTEKTRLTKADRS